MFTTCMLPLERTLERTLERETHKASLEAILNNSSHVAASSSRIHTSFAQSYTSSTHVL
jgi:hypothetical protein